jgi:hypothetical protein
MRTIQAVLLVAVACWWSSGPLAAAPMAPDARQRFAYDLLVEVQTLADQVPPISAETAARMKGEQWSVVRSGTLRDYRGLAEQNEFLLWKVHTRAVNLTTALNKLVRGRFPDIKAEMEEWKVVSEELRENDTFFALDHLERSGAIAKPVRIEGQAVREVFGERFRVLQADIVEPFVNGRLPK